MMSDCQHLELSKKISAKCILGLFAVCMITTTIKIQKEYLMYNTRRSTIQFQKLDMIFNLESHVMSH